MPCPRCAGLMVLDQFADFLHDGGYHSFTGWRCLCCGNVLDSVIIRNRQASLTRGIVAAFQTDENHDARPSVEAAILVSSAA